MTVPAGGWRVSPPVLIVVAVLIVGAIISAGWFAAGWYRELQGTLQAAADTIEVQRMELSAMRDELAAIRADLAGIRAVAAQAKTRIIEYRRDAQDASTAVDCLPVSELEPRLRAVADAYSADTPAGGAALPAHPPDR